MNAESLTWHPFHPERGGLPPELQLPASTDSGDGRVVLLAALERSGEARWSARAAVRIAREWAAAGERVFLADLGFDDPALHEVLEEENGEGMSDALLWGASVQRVARPVGEGFFFAPAGTVVAPSTDVLGQAGWDEMIDGFVAAGVTLVLFAPSPGGGAGGGAAPASPASGAFARVDLRVVLAAAGSMPEAVDTDGPGRLLAVLAPGAAPENGGGFEAPGAVAAAEPTVAGAGAGAGPAGSESAPAGAAAQDPPMAAAAAGGAGTGRGDAGPERDAAAAGGDDRSAESGADRPPVETPYVPRSRRPAARKPVRPWLLLMLLLLVGGVLAAAWFGWVEIPGITPAPAVDAAFEAASIPTLHAASG